MRIRLAEVAQLQTQDPAQNRQTEEMLTFLDLVTKSTGEQLKAEAAAQTMLSTMTEQNAVAEAIARSGADSVEVTRLRAQFALDAKLEEIEASKASEATKDALRDAAQAAFDLSTADISGVLNAAANEAARLSAEVRGAVDAMFDLQSQGQAQLETARIAEHNRRSALLICYSALEVGIKQHIAKCVKDAGWLAIYAPSPPLFKILNEYLPEIHRGKNDFKSWERIKGQLKLIIEFSEDRNRLAHRGETIRGSLDAYIEITENLLYAFDVLEGHAWAKTRVSRSFGELLGWKQTSDTP